MNLNKKAQGATDIMWQTLVLVIIVALVVVMLIYAMINQADSEANVEQTLSKQIALLIDSSHPGSEFEIPSKGILEIRKENQDVCVQIKTTGIGQCYRTFSRFNFEIIKKEASFIVKVG